VLIILAAAALASRRYLLERSGGTVECALRWPAGSGAWRLGVLSYQHDSLRWHGALGVLLRPEYVFHRRALSVLSRRPADPSETVTLGADRIVVEVSAPSSDTSVSLSGEHVELAMTEQALTGFLAWLEASPPGSHLGDFSLNQNPGQRWVAGRGGIARALVGLPMNPDRWAEGARAHPRRAPLLSESGIRRFLHALWCP
jgi:hypothetical protein